MAKENFIVTGMSCAACVARIEKNVSQVAGVSDVSVNLLKNSMSVEFDESALSANDIINIVEKIGFGATKKTAGKPSKVVQGTPPDKTQAQMKPMQKRLIWSVIFALPLFYIAMAEMVGLPVPAAFSHHASPISFGLIQLFLVTPIIVINRHYFEHGFKNLWAKSPNMDSLIALGAAAAFVYSSYSLFKMAGAPSFDEMRQIAMNSLYFESAGMILTLITVGKYLESRAKNKTTDAITKLMNLTPKTATIMRDGNESEIAVEDIVEGDKLIVKAGETIPVDGTVISGEATIDESAITGESIPADRSKKDRVVGGTILKSGYIQMVATAVGENTTIAKIIKLVDEATSSKAPIEQIADKVSGFFVPVVITIALVSGAVWYFSGQNFEFALTVAISILVISCPCALGLATPTAIMVGTGQGARHGILVKSAKSLELAHKIDTIVLDKTGTITEGKPAIIGMHSAIDLNDFMEIAASLEAYSHHPLAEAVVQAATEKKIALKAVAQFESLHGKGVKGIIDGMVCLGGNALLMREHKVAMEQFSPEATDFSNQGKTVLYFAKHNELIGIIAIADTVKPSSKNAVEKLKNMGLDVIMLTGDNAKTAEYIRGEIGILKAIAEVLPDQKEEVIHSLQKQGKKVAMVGDGINDAPALARADIGIAIGSGTDIAIESADIVLIKNDLMGVSNTISLSRAVMRNIKQNLFWAFIYNIIGIPIAAGVLYLSTGVLLNPIIAAAAMSFSSVSVVLNALRLKPKFYI